MQVGLRRREAEHEEEEPRLDCLVIGERSIQLPVVLLLLAILLRWFGMQVGELLEEGNYIETTSNCGNVIVGRDDGGRTDATVFCKERIAVIVGVH